MGAAGQPARRISSQPLQVRQPAQTYRDVDLAIATVRDDFGYYGSITLATEQRPKVGKTQAGPIADSDEE